MWAVYNVLRYGMKIKKRIYFLLFSFIPIAFIAFSLSVNKYTVLGMKEAVDCDGPLSVMLFSIPVYIVYGVGLLIFGKALFISRKIKYIIMFILCLSVIALITPNTLSALKAHNVNSTINKSQCGVGW